MKAIILSGGHGTRLRPLTYSQQKQLIHVANKPILFYAIEDVIEAGIHDIGIIVGPNADLVKETVLSRKWDANIEFIYQGDPKGLAHAIKVARNYLGDDDFVMYLGDNILREGIVEHLDHFKKGNYDASILLCEVPNPECFGVVELSEDGNTIKRLVEKPKNPPSNLALVGIYFFKPIIHEAVRNIKPSWRNELEITDAIQWLIDHGYRVGWTKVTGWWKDTGKPEDIVDANRLILDDIQTDVKVETKARLHGRVVVGEGTQIDENTVIKGPAIIGRDCVIKNAYIGPYTSIGDNCIIEDTEIEDSIIMDGAYISCGGRIVESLIGNEVRIMEKDQHPIGRKLVLGDRSQVIL